MATDYRYLDPNEIVATVELLQRRIDERFPGSGLSNVCRQLVTIARDAQRRAEWIAQPILGLRISIAVLIAVIVLGLIGSFTLVEIPDRGWNLIELVQIFESGVNDAVFIGAAIFFLVTLETRIKRARALDALHELRSVAHIIDMHQLTKDPERLLWRGEDTQSSPRREMTMFALSRYLDYCSEMLSLTGKIAALYIQNFDDGVALSAVNEIEDLSTGLSRKIWQKLMILHTVPIQENEPPMHTDEH